MKDIVWSDISINEVVRVESTWFFGLLKKYNYVKVYNDTSKKYAGALYAEFEKKKWAMRSMDRHQILGHR